MTVPQWVKDAIFYQIFPDRFANGDPNNDPPNIQTWGTRPTRRRFQGGDLKGIIEHIDYLLDLGINAIYLNPIFMSASPHRYDTLDYLRVDPKLGTLEDFHELVRTCHQNDVRIILDGVFNHCARGFFAFNDILENEDESPYLDWFHIKKFPLHAYDKGKSGNYKACWGIKSLPKFNINHPPVRRYLLDVARYWIEQGADGWRLDVPNEIDDDSFWTEFRQVVLPANPEAYLLGEIWEGSPRWVDNAHFDGLMNYPLRNIILNYVSEKITSSQFIDSLEEILYLYPQENRYAMYNLIGSHDTERILNIFESDPLKVRLAFLILFSLPGVPAIFYGDEVGLPGAGDPDCLRAFHWNRDQWDEETREWLKMLVAVRKSTPALRYGEFYKLLAKDSPAFSAFARTLNHQIVIATINSSDEPVSVEIPANGFHLAESALFHCLTGGGEVPVRDGQIQIVLGPFEGMLWVCDRGDIDE